MAAVLSHTVRMMLEQIPDFICVALDVQNTHNAISRSAVVRRLDAVLELRHGQGDSEANGCFCVGWHPEVMATWLYLAVPGCAQCPAKVFSEKKSLNALILSQL